MQGNPLRRNGGISAEFGQAIAIAKGTPANPLAEPEDLFDAAAHLGGRRGGKGGAGANIQTSQFLTPDPRPLNPEP